MSRSSTQGLFFHLPWRERFVMLVLLVLVAWEFILIAYKFSNFPYSAVDFFQHYFLGLYVNRGGSIADPEWPQRVGSILGAYLPAELEETAPYLHYQIFLLPIFRLLAFLPMSPAYALWLVACLTLMGWAGARVAPELGIRRSLMLFILFLWPPVWHVLNLGNVDALIWVLMSLGWMYFLRRREGWGGFWMGLAAALKGFPAFAAIPWLFRNPRPVLRGMAAGLLVALGWGTLGAGIEGWRFVVRHVSDYQQALAPFMPANNSLLAVLWAFVGPPVSVRDAEVYHGLLPGGISSSALFSLYPVFSALFLLFLWLAFRRVPFSLNPIGHSGAWLSAGLLVWPISWINYHIYLFVPLVWLFVHREQLRTSTRVLFYGATLPLMAALSHGLLVGWAAPYMFASVLMGLDRFLLFWIFQRSTREISPSEASGTRRVADGRDAFLGES